MQVMNPCRAPWLLLLAAAAFPQQSSSPPETVLRVTVNLVQVDAVVTDSRGRQVTNLEAKDFEILQDGKPQKITHFAYIDNSAPAPVRVVDKTAPPPPPATVRPAQVRRTMALVVDDLGLTFESTARVRAALKKFVDERMQPGDLVAIVRTGAGMGALQQFTSDKRQLYAAIERVRWNAFGRSGIGTFAPLGGDSPDDDMAAADTRADEFREQMFSVGTLGAINFVVQGLKDLPGRKSVILFSDNMRLFNSEGMNDIILENLRHLTDLANRAAVVIYTIDPRGLETLSLTAADNTGGLRGDQLAEAQMQRHQAFWDSQEGLNFLAQETGGLFFHDNNDIGAGIDTVMDDQKGYYLIGYTPDPATFDAVTGARKFHSLKVRVLRPGLHVRSRNGFFGVPDQDSHPGPRTRDQQLLAALVSPFGSGGIHLRLTSLFANGPKVGSFVNTLLHIDGHDLTFTDEPEGWHKAVLDVVMITFGDNGQEVDRSNRTFTIRTKGQEYEAAVKNGFIYTIHHPVKKPGAYQLRTAVRDASSEKVGSASQFIEVPDVNKGRLALSGIVVRSNVSKAQQGEGQAQEPDPNESPALRIFKPGHMLMYGYYIFNAQVNKGTHQPELEVQMRLFRDGKPVYTGKPVELQAGPDQPDLKRLLAGGRLQLGSKMQPGEYVIQVVVTDKLAKEKYRRATQSIDFEVQN